MTNLFNNLNICAGAVFKAAYSPFISSSLVLSTILIHKFAFLIFLFTIFLLDCNQQILGGLFQTTILSNLSNDILLSTFVPVMIYHNAETDKSKIYSDNNGRTGIYQWTHIESGKYISVLHIT